jgi:hypothetical protein
MPIPFAAIGLGISAISSGVNLISGLSRKSKAKKQLANFQRQELRNITEGMRVSTLGAELQTQEAQRRFSTSVDALRSGGVRGVVGGLGRQEQLQQVQQQRISADLDRQQVAIEQMRAQDESRIRAMQEQRETSAIAGLGREISEGRNQAQAGAAGLVGTAFAGYELDKAGAFDNGLFGSPRSNLDNTKDDLLLLQSSIPSVRSRAQEKLKSAAASSFGGGVQEGSLPPYLGAIQAFTSASGFNPSMMTEGSQFLVDQIDQRRGE